jgi:hypothetical protein
LKSLVPTLPKVTRAKRLWRKGLLYGYLTVKPFHQATHKGGKLAKVFHLSRDINDYFC